MANHKEYDKVQRWDHADEVSGINIGTIYIQEKIDGANAQVCQGKDGYLYVGSRTRVVGRAKNEDGWPFEINDSFRGLPEYIFNHKKIRQFFKDNGDRYILYGEWLVKHTVNYPDEFKNRFWIFDVYDRKEHRYVPFTDYFKWIEDNWGLDMVGLVTELENPSMDDLLDMVRKKDKIPPSEFGAEVVEGLVYKNYDFLNMYGRCAYMKAVTKDFMEVHHTVMGASRHDPPEVYLIAKYLTPARMEKVYSKMIDEAPHNTLSMKNTGEFLERVLHDLITEDAWTMFMRDKKVRKCPITMTTLRKVSSAKAKNWWVNKLQEELSGESESTCTPR